jgi:ABC-type lipoprotein export system ATPase subunit
MPPLVRLDRVTKAYTAEGQAVLALDGLSLDIHPGQFVAVVGPSGCGKSTLLNLAGAMDFPTSGDVLIEGQSTTGLPDAALTRLRRDKVGFVFQSFQLLPTLNIIENVELPRLLAGFADARDRALVRLGQVGMRGYDRRHPHQLSGGQMQRVAIARALVNAPRLLLADEPTGNLDSATGHVILELLHQIVREHGTTVVMATHSLEAARLADRVVALRDGRLQAGQGTS